MRATAASRLDGSHLASLSKGARARKPKFGIGHNFSPIEGVQKVMKFTVSARFARMSSLCLVAVLLATAVGCNHRQAPVKTAQHLDFNQDVQPILARNCFSCHGPDPEMRKAGLRLDLAESALRKRQGHPDAIVPGHPEQSELIKRVESNDPHYLMPQSPQSDAKPMKPEEIAALKEWVREGARYRPHWAFEKPVQVPLPVVDQEVAWVKTPIDAFILAALKKEGLHPSPETDKETLIRRVTLDLTGLLPTPSEVRAFVKDTSSQAYEHVIDRLLASPSFGEQRARYWLDYARYGDTYGLHYDNSRDIWPYRDYVISSFNSNKPFDQFAMEQIAGDLMSAKNLDPLIGSGFVRLGVSSNEGGTIPEELRANIARERTEAFGATFMGLTVGCAVCHDHKYDPTTQKDFYSLSAFFNNIDEKPFNGDRPVWTPVVRIPNARNQEAYNQVFAKRSELAVQLNAERLRVRALVLQWLASGQEPPKPVSTDKLILRLRLDEGGGDVLKNSAPNASPASFPIGKSKPQWGETTFLWPDFRMETGTRVMLRQTGDYEWNQSFSAGGWLMLRTTPSLAVSLTHGALFSKMDATLHYRGWDLSISRGILSVELVNEAPKEQLPPPKPHLPGVVPGEEFRFPTPIDLTSKDLAPNGPPHKPTFLEAKKSATPPKDQTPRFEIKVSTIHLLPLDGLWKHVFFTYDGSGKASGIKIYINGAAVSTRVVSDTLHRRTMRTQAPMQLGWRYPDADPVAEVRYQDVRLYARALTPEEVNRLSFEDYVAEIARTPASRWNDDQWHAVSEFYLNSLDKSFRALKDQIAQLDLKLDKLSEGGPLTLVAWEKSSLAYAYVLTRGVYTARTERVEANTPHFLPPLPPGEPHDRLTLAKWTVSPDNPLTARVTVNRMWYELFGTGLVETTEDFGIMGQRPSNPQLLDWLAVEFRQSGWNVKKMYKLMVMSAAYRQSARSTPEQLAKDPKNILLSHGPRFRMDAEMLRDIALQSGGLLVNEVGGPSVKPYQPANVWEQVSYPLSDTLTYKQEHGDALYRRSIYTFWKRMAVMPDMDAFDAPMRDVACTRRQRTDTPLQALVTLNDVQWIETARALAQRVILQAGPQSEKRIDLMSEILLSHDPSPQMATVLEGSIKQMQRHYETDPKAAQELLAVGEKQRDQAIPAPELAAWTMVASEMLNLDETVTK